MSDDLVMWLRGLQSTRPYLAGCEQRLREAADRIELLDARVEEQERVIIDIQRYGQRRIDELEAALRDVLDSLHGPFWESGAALNKARRVLEGKL